MNIKAVLKVMIAIKKEKSKFKPFISHIINHIISHIISYIISKEVNQNLNLKDEEERMQNEKYIFFISLNKNRIRNSKYFTMVQLLIIILILNFINKQK